MKKKTYYLSDLVEIAKQLGGRIQLQVLPQELLQQKSLPEKHEKPKAKKKKGI